MIRAEVHYEATVAGFERQKKGMEAAAKRFVDQSTAMVTRTAMVNANTGQHSRGEPHIPGTGPGPNLVSGTLVRSIKPTVTKRTTAGYEGSATVGEVYARAVELGHPRWREGVMYPFFIPAIRVWQAKSRALLAAVLREARKHG